jgi:hypothetical protein
MYSKHYKVGQHILDAFEVECPASATYPLAAAVGHLHLYALRPGVQGVFAELLDHRGGAVDDLPDRVPVEVDVEVVGSWGGG